MSAVDFSRAFCVVVSARFQVSILFILLILGFSNSATFSQTIDSTFAPLLQDFGSVQNRAVAQVSALQPDGKILVGGQFTVASGLPRSGVARFNPDGTPDPTFDAGNIGVAEALLTNETGGLIDFIKVYPTGGKILIGGSFRRDEEGGIIKTIERLNADGSRDQTFQSTTIINAGIGDAEIQPDGKIVVGGSFRITATNPANGQSVLFKNLARLNPDGSFDFSFNGNGLENSNNIVILPNGKIVVGNAYLTQPGEGTKLVRYDANGNAEAVLTEFSDWIEALELLPDGKFVVAGYFNVVNGNPQRRVVRLNADGSQDMTFATPNGFIDGLVFSDVAVQADGKIVVCGDFSLYDNFSRWRVMRFNTNGSVDQTFNTSTPIAGVVWDILPLPNGKIFIGGAFPLEDANFFYNNIGRLNSDGSIDTNFNHANVIMEGEGYSILQQPDGKIIIGGFIYYVNDQKKRGVVRLNADGTLDAGFNPAPNLLYALDVALQADGKILVVNSDSPSTLLRLNADGSLDSGFTAPFIPSSASIQKRTRITTVVVQPDQKILVGGLLLTGSTTAPNISGLVRLNPDGSRDTTFQLVGAVGGIKNVYDIALQPDGRILIGGDFGAINGNGAYHLLARINSDGTIDSSFTSPPAPPTSTGMPIFYEIELQTDGKVVYAGNFDAVLRVNANGSPDAGFNVPLNGDGVRALLFQPGSGKILVGGYFTNVAGAARNRIARLNADGTLDARFDLPNGANNIVYDLLLQQDGRILVAGAFTKLGNQPRIGAARLIESNRTAFDFDGDGRADIGVFRQGTWYIQQSTAGFAGVQFGISTDKLVPADYDGDGKTDFGVFRGGVWYLQRSRDGFRGFQFGLADDIPQTGDFDGDGRADFAVFRPSNGTWYVQQSTSGFMGVQFGQNGDKPVAADFDGDGRTDAAVYRAGVWYVLQSRDGFRALQFGILSDKPVVGDYDGDGKADFTVYRDGVWYQQRSRGGFVSVQFGIGTDLPAPADFDGDGKTDLAVFRSGVWYLLQSTSGFAGTQFGAPGDIPVSAVTAP